MELALPLRSLREVVPCERLAPLPCPNAAIVGGIDLRGVVVPVLDLRITLNKPAPAIAAANVMIMVHAGHILGLLCGDVKGVFGIEPGALKPMGSAEGDAALFQGAIVRPDTGAMVGVISPEALYASPGIPRVQDPEPERSLEPLNTDPDESIDQPFLPVMLMRCGSIALCIDAMAVSATLMAPVVRPSPLAMGHCRGVIEHGGMDVAAIDLRAMLNMGEAAATDRGQAFLMNTAEGSVAFLISEVIDVVRTRSEARIAIPRFARPHPKLVTATLPSDALPSDFKHQGKLDAGQFMLVQADELRQDELVRSLSAAVKQRGSSAPAHTKSTTDFVAAASESHLGQTILTYQLQGETASPLGQIQEILPCPADIVTYSAPGALLGTMISRGRSIPVICLLRLMGLPSPALTPQCSVLVVAGQDDLVGFAVPMLKSIETANSKSELGRPAAEAPASVETAMRQRTLIKIGSSSQERLLPLLDLQAVANALQAEMA